jgi:hypothetical protein
MATAEEYEKMSTSEKKKEDWMNAKWRPMMGWIYMLTCVTDFIIFPILWSMLQAALKQPVTAWQPITLQGAGLFHLSMGAIIGVAAFGRTQEKLAGANNGGINVPSGGAPAFSPAPTGGFGSSGGFSSPAPTGFGSNSGFGAPASASSSAGFGGGSFGSSSPATGQVVAGFGGKPAPVQEPQPLL